MTPAPAVAIAPAATDDLMAAVERGGGTPIDDPTRADAVIWVDPRNPEGLREVLAGSPARWVQLPFAGIERFVAAGVIDPERTWTCTKGVYAHACAEHALALMLAAGRRLHEHAVAQSWRAGGFGTPERRLAGKTVVIVGAGGIGRALIEMLGPLHARAIAVNRSGRSVGGAERTVIGDALRDVVAEADFLVVSAASTPATRHVVDADVLAALPSHAWIVNVARGELIDTDALVAALRAAEIGGAALDVTDPEPLPDGHPLWELPNVIITPHVANTWDMAVPELTALVERNVAAFAAGHPLEGLVDPDAGY